MQSTDPILLVEDDMVDAMTVKRALQDLKVLNEVIHTTNGEEALDYLSNPMNCKPCIILLDINMPKMNGIEFLKEAKSRNDLGLIPVVMLTTSTNDKDMVESFSLNVASYIVKPVDHQQLVDTVETIEAFWRLGRVPK
ncbi:MAG: response regulator [Phycisphaerae bacterium]|nr:response regulator [Phycisphaerae bacterium]